MKTPSYIINIPAEDYHAATKRNEYTSSHRLHLFRKCPALYYKHITGAIVEEDTQAFVIGRATHTLTLEGREKFEAEYLVSDGPTNPKTGKPYTSTSQAWKDWAASQKSEIVPTADFETMRAMADAVRAHEKAQQLLAIGIAEATVRTRWNGEPIQARLDWFDPVHNRIIDLKTCNDLDRFLFDVRDFGYVNQLAFYAQAIDLARADTGEDIDQKTPECWLIAVEKREPFRVGVFQIAAATIDDGNFAPGGTKYGPGNELMIKELQECRTGKSWPTRYEGFGII